jgi:hypothetical protein
LADGHGASGIVLGETDDRLSDRGRVERRVIVDLDPAWSSASWKPF